MNAKDEDGDTALHLVLMKKSQITTDVQYEGSPVIHGIYESLESVSEHKTAIAIASYLIKAGIDVEAVNSKGLRAFDLLRDDVRLREMLRSQKVTTVEVELMRLEGLTMNNDANDEDNDITVSENFNLITSEDRDRRKPVECLVCSELSEENVRLEPCDHKPACEDCSSRMKKCLQCGVLVQKRVTKDGRTIPVKSRQPSAERMRYLECKIAEIEESHACSICMERKRNMVFLCGHGTCSKCADTLKTCHMCRKTITKKIPIY